MHNNKCFSTLVKWFGDIFYSLILMSNFKLRIDNASFRKYPNRRIYDLEQSKYVTLDTVLEVILSGRSVRVEMAETEEDVTQSTLLQVLAEKEKAVAL